MDDVQWRFSHGNKVEAKYCPIEIDGDVKYYICPRNEICCTFGCCISSNFHFYQLWYYWLMVILMFLLCSGGTWWYRYWLQEGHYAHPSASTHRPQPPPRHRAAPTRVAYHQANNTVVVQQIWKPQRNGRLNYPNSPPLYSMIQQSNTGVEVAASSTANPGNVARLKPSPYYQLYGPPPSYDSVVSDTLAERGQSVEGSCGEQTTELHSESRTLNSPNPDAHSSITPQSQQCDNEPSALAK